jgi:hypothetical protein
MHKLGAENVGLPLQNAALIGEFTLGLDQPIRQRYQLLI